MALLGQGFDASSYTPSYGVANEANDQLYQAQREGLHGVQSGISDYSKKQSDLAKQDKELAARIKGTISLLDNAKGIYKDFAPQIDAMKTQLSDPSLSNLNKAGIAAQVDNAISMFAKFGTDKINQDYQNAQLRIQQQNAETNQANANQQGRKDYALLSSAAGSAERAINFADQNKIQIPNDTLSALQGAIDSGDSAQANTIASSLAKSIDEVSKLQRTEPKEDVMINGTRARRGKQTGAIYDYETGNAIADSAFQGNQKIKFDSQSAKRIFGLVDGGQGQGAGETGYDSRFNNLPSVDAAAETNPAGFEGDIQTLSGVVLPKNETNIKISQDPNFDIAEYNGQQYAIPKQSPPTNPQAKVQPPASPQVNAIPAQPQQMNQQAPVVDKPKAQQIVSVADIDTAKKTIDQTDSAISTLESMYKTMTDLQNHKGFNGVFGTIGTSFISGSDAKDALNKFDSVKGKAFVDAVIAAKGSGLSPLSNDEGEKLLASQLEIKTNSSEKEARRILSDMRGVIENRLKLMYDTRNDAINQLKPVAGDMMKLYGTKQYKPYGGGSTTTMNYKNESQSYLDTASKGVNQSNQTLTISPPSGYVPLGARFGNTTGNPAR
jgi:hypothetical protein